MSNAILYVITVLVWGSTWFAIEFQLGEVAPEVSLVYRYLGAAACLFGWCLWRGQRLRFEAKAHTWFVLLGALLSLGLAVPLGMIAALRPYSWLDYGVNLFSFAGLSVPSFWLSHLRRHAVVPDLRSDPGVPAQYSHVYWLPQYVENLSRIPTH